MVYLGFKLMIIYKVISCVLGMLYQIPHIIEIIRKEKRDKARLKQEEEKAKIISDERNQGGIQADYKSTKIGFIITDPISDQKGSS